MLHLNFLTPKDRLRLAEAMSAASTEDPKQVIEELMALERRKRYLRRVTRLNLDKHYPGGQDHDQSTHGRGGGGGTRAYEGFDARQREVFDARLDALEAKYGTKPVYAGTGNDAEGRKLAVETLNHRLKLPESPFNRLDDVRRDIEFIENGGNPLDRPSWSIHGYHGVRGETMRLGNGKYAVFLRDDLEATPMHPDLSTISDLEKTLTHEYGHVWHLSIGDMGPQSPVPYISMDLGVADRTDGWQTFDGVIETAERAIVSTTQYSNTNTFEKVAEAFRLHETGVLRFRPIEILTAQAEEARSWSIPGFSPGDPDEHERGMAILQEMMERYK